MTDADKLQALILICFIVLKGVEGYDWDYYQNQYPLELVVALSIN